MDLNELMDQVGIAVFHVDEDGLRPTNETAKKEQVELTKQEDDDV